MKLKITPLIRKLNSRFALALALLAAMVALSVISAVKFNASFAPGTDTSYINTKNISAENVLQNLSVILGFPKEELFVPLKPIDSAFYINHKTSTLIFRTGVAELPMTFEKNNAHSVVLKPEAHANLDSVAKNYFSIKDYAILITDSNFSKSEAEEIAKSIGADTGLVGKLYGNQTNKQITARNTLLYLLYNTTAGGDNERLATITDARKHLKIINKKDYIEGLDIIDKSKMISGLNNIPEKNATTAFIVSEYYKIYPDRKPQRDPTKAVPLQTKIDRTFGENAILLNPNAPFEPVYINFSQGSFYAGDNNIRFDAKYAAIDRNKLKAFFEKQFAIYDTAKGNVQTIASHAGIPLYTTDTTEDHLQLFFKSMVNHIAGKADTYVIADGKLMTLTEQQQGNLLFGRFDDLKLDIGYGKLNPDVAPDANIAIVKKSRFTKAIVYTTLFLLPVVTAFLLLFSGRFSLAKRAYPANRVAEKPMPVALNIPARIENAESFNPGNNAASRQSDIPAEQVKSITLESIIDFLNGKNNDHHNLPKGMQTIRKKISAYDAATQSKSPGELAKVINSNDDFGFDIRTTDDLFEDVKTKKQEFEKVNELLAAYDRYSGEALTTYYAGQRSKNKKSEKLRELFTENTNQDLYAYIQEKVSEVEQAPSIENFVKFTTLFKSSANSRFKPIETILKEHQLTNEAIDSFIAKCRKIENPSSPNLLERISLLSWSLDLSGRLTDIRKGPKVSSTEKIMQEQFQLVFLKLFIHHAKDVSKTTKDFGSSIDEMSKKIQEYNTLYTDPALPLQMDTEQLENIEQLKEFMRKIRKHDKTEIVFGKLQQHFIQGFNDRIDKLRFTAEELHAEDRAWLYEQLFNIAFHTADYVDHFVKEDGESWHHNLAFLLTDLDLNKIGHNAFIENSMAQSSKISNAVVKAARYGGVKKLNFLIDGYYITPEQLS